MHNLGFLWWTLWLLTAGSASPDDVKPSEKVAKPASGPSMIVRPDQQPATTPVVPAGSPNSKQPSVSTPSSQATPSSQTTPGTAEPTKADKQPEATKEERPVTIKRPEKPTEPADPDELKVRPDADGLIRFQFRGQVWPDVLDWLGEISGMSVDWQELPNDYINLATQRGYSVEQLHDLLNRLLLVRGFTILQQDQMLTVVKCDQLSAALVPRVTPEQLEKLSPHQFVRVMFTLDWLLARNVAEELKPLLSTNGKMLPLQASNRIEAMDAVVNLREIARVLKEEQADRDGGSRLVREFVLQYARADEVRESLVEFVGVESGASKKAVPMTSKQRAQQQAMMQLRMQQAQQAAQARQRQAKPSTKTLVTPRMPDKPVRLMVNRRRNSLLVQAPPDKMAVIADAIKLLDVPPEGATSLQALLGRMQVYRLSQLDPRKLVDTLTALGGLDPTTRLEVDETNRAIIAYATPTDHFTIRSTVEKLDSSARRVEVIPLRKLAADEVAGTLQYLMAGQREQQSQRSYDYSRYYGSRRSSGQENKDQFRVDADVVNNRLLVRANDMELEEVVSILVKLGELPRPGAEQGMTRVLDIVPGDQAAKFYEQLQRQWETLAPNPLILPVLPKKRDEPVEENNKSPTKGPAKQVDSPRDRQDRDDNTMVRFMPAVLLRAERAPEHSPPEPPPTSAPPITISITPDGRLVLASKDARALAQLEELATRLAPPRKDYRIFKLQYASATWVSFNLEEFFEDEDATDNDRGQDRFYSMYFGIPPASRSKKGKGLSKRRPLKFITDIDTNTILVQGADAQQLRTIEELIEMYDVPEPQNSQKTRVTRLFSIQYSKASIIAETIKDAYRDLLSANDKALQQGRKGQQPQRYSSGMSFMGPFGVSSGTDKESRTSVRFKGQLSIGIDDVSNTLLVSTEGENLMAVVGNMIEALDKAAQPVSEIHVITLRPGTDGSRIEKTLAKVLGQQAQAASKLTGRRQSPGQGFPGNGRSPRPGGAMPAR